MKLAAREAKRYFRAPEADCAGLLIFGADPMRVALHRQEVIKALVGPEGEAEMRLSRQSGAELLRDPASLIDALKAQGFFPGPRVVFVEDAGDGLAGTIGAALEAWAPGDAQIIVTAGQLAARSVLRKLFEGHKNAYAAGVYDDPPGREEVEAMLREAGLLEAARPVMEDILAMSRALSPGDFRQVLEKVGLYKHGDPAPLTSAELAACAPATAEAELDDILHIVAEARASEVGPVLRRLEGRGVNAVSLCIGAARHFRILHAAACDPGGPAAGLSRARPPVFGPRRERMQRQAQSWGVRRLEQALMMLTDTDLALRSAARAPSMAVMERTLIRLAMLGRNR